MTDQTSIRTERARDRLRAYAHAYWRYQQSEGGTAETARLEELEEGLVADLVGERVRGPIVEHTTEPTA